MIVVVQEIELWWTKSSRAGEGAKARAAVPELLPLPALASVPDESLVHQQVKIEEWNGFDARVETVEVSPMPVTRRKQMQCVTIGRDGEGHALAEYRYTMAGGAPERASIPRTVLTLAPGQWGRVRYNGRHNASVPTGWLYHKTVINLAPVAVFTGTPFLGGPTREFSDMADLR
jgi:hypothetical protein